MFVLLVLENPQNPQDLNFIPIPGIGKFSLSQNCFSIFQNP